MEEFAEVNEDLAFVDFDEVIGADEDALLFGETFFEAVTDLFEGFEGEVGLLGFFFEDGESVFFAELVLEKGHEHCVFVLGGEIKFGQ